MGKKYDKLLQLVQLCMEQVYQNNLEDSGVSFNDFVIVTHTLHELREMLRRNGVSLDCPSIGGDSHG